MQGMKDIKKILKKFNLQRKGDLMNQSKKPENFFCIFCA